jgi:hypothetical protein
MKKTVIFILLSMVGALHADTTSDPAAGGDTSMCYVPEQSNSSANKDLCSYMETQKSLAIDICEFAPELPGFTKKKNTLSFDTDQHMQSFCQKNIQEQAQSAIKDIDIFSKENNFNFGASSNGTDDAEKEAGKFFAKGGSSKEIMKNSESVARQALYSGNQKVMREAVNYAKNSNTTMSNVTLKELSAPSNYTQYLLDRKALVKGSFSDHFSQSPLTVTSEARNKVQTINDPKEATNTTQQITANASDKIDFGTNKRIQLYLDASARDSDYAIPTQEMVSLLREDLRAEAIANIKQQMKREALVISENMQIAQARKDLLTIAGNKATVITRPFNTTEATKKIDDLIDTSSSSTSSTTSGTGGTGDSGSCDYNQLLTLLNSGNLNYNDLLNLLNSSSDITSLLNNGGDITSLLNNGNINANDLINNILNGADGTKDLVNEVLNRINKANLNVITKDVIICSNHCITNGNGYIEAIKLCFKRCIDGAIKDSVQNSIDIKKLLTEILTKTIEDATTSNTTSGGGSSNTNTGDNNDAGSGTNANTAYIGEDNSYGGGD